MGRTESLAFSFTYGMMDMGDYFIENIKNKTYQRENEFIKLTEHTYNVDGKTVKFYETEEGHVIERSIGEVDKELLDGKYLSLRLAEPTEHEATCFKIAEIPFYKSVKDVQPILPQSFLGMT